MKFVKMWKNLCVGMAIVTCGTCLWTGCSDTGSDPKFPEVEKAELSQGDFSFSGWKLDSADLDDGLIYLSSKKDGDSILFSLPDTSGRWTYYLAKDNDPVDPELGEKLEEGSVIDLDGSDRFAFVALDSYNRIAGVWTVVILQKASSSSAKSETAESSSGTSKNSSASESSSSSVSGGENSGNSSSSSVIGSSGDGDSSGSSSASGESSGSASSGIKLADLSVESGTVTVTDNKVYVEVPYGTDLSAIALSPLEGTWDLRRSVEMQFLDAEDNLGTYSVVAGVQLPGSDFSARNDFWATTSDAMATEGSGKWLAIFTIDMISSANMSFSGEEMTLDSRVVTGAAIAGVIDGGWKLAGGFYYAGAFSGTDCASIYQAENSDAGTGDADFSVYMSHGKPFSARPTSFKVKYSYSHVAGKNANYPQKSLIYVILVSAEGKVVATGAIADDATVENTEREVNLSYGADPFGLLTGGYPVAANLELGTGNEDVESIHVMFASSAYAHVASGSAGSDNVAASSYRGGKNSSLTLDDFKLIY